VKVGKGQSNRAKLKNVWSSEGIGNKISSAIGIKKHNRCTIIARKKSSR